MHSVELNIQFLQGLGTLDIDSVWVPDHMLGIAHPALWTDIPASAMLPDPDGWLDPFCLAALASRHTNLSIGTCVTDAIRRRGADLARTALTLHQACAGGFVLGIGAGEAESTVPFGYSFARPVDRLEEALRDIRCLLDTGAMPGTGVGRTGLPRDGAFGTPAVWVAAHGPRTLQLTGRFGDGWLPPTTTPQQYATQLATVKQSAERAERPCPVASYFPLVVFGPSRDAVAAALETNPLSMLILLFAPASLWHEHGMDHPFGPDCRGYPDVIPHAMDPESLRTLATQIPMELVEAFLIFGNADDVVARLAAYHEAGMEHVVLCDLTGFTFAPDQAAAYASELARAATILRTL
jgi:phthiodiolone/phenolphthiodiolone dimycocerosates ketoreductase